MSSYRPWLTEHRWTMTIEQNARWGPTKWRGNITSQFREPDGRWSIGSEYEYGWFSWSRKRLEKKLRRRIKHESKRHEFRLNAERVEIHA